jgi:glycosyltransferase involved in cell wall biosynthesis/GT2 family glycosyltransferase
MIDPQTKRYRALAKIEAGNVRRTDQNECARHDRPASKYVPRYDRQPLGNAPVKFIAFYLPQFHPTPENDAFWGKGFTDWANVQAAKPQFEGHYQPHLPGELGYYNLLDRTVLRRQVELAKLYGLGGFCFHFYWFGGKRPLEKPVKNYLGDTKLDLPFCLCWANENWTRRWDGRENEVLIAQNHSAKDDLDFIKHISKYLDDSRYIRIDGKPLLLVYRPNLLPSGKETAVRWREWCRNNGLGELYLAYTQSFEQVDPAIYGFDAAIEFHPNMKAELSDLSNNVAPLCDDFACEVLDWRPFVEDSRQYMSPYYKLFRAVCPSWDNTPRRKNSSRVLLNSSPRGYHEWLLNAINDTCERFQNPDERLVFANAWNEWAEGAHLEPDARYGYAYLEATRLALAGAAYEPISRDGLTWNSGYFHGRLKFGKGKPVALLCGHLCGHQVFGAERSLVDTLDALLTIGVNVIVSLPQTDNNHYLDAIRERSVGVYILPYQQWGHSPEDDVVVERFIEIIQQHKVNVVHANTIMLREALTAARKCGVTTVVHAREMIGHDEVLAKQIGLSSEQIVAQVVARSDYIIANSEATAKCFRRTKPVHIVPNAVDVGELDLPNVVDQAEVRFVMAGHDLGKSLYDLVDLAKRCEGIVPSARFLIIGPETPDTTAIEKDQREGRGPKNIKFLGYRKTPREVMAEANVVLNLSHFAESFGRTVAEAMAARRPVIAYNLGALPELIQAGETGFLVSYRNVDELTARVKELCENPNVILEMGQRGRAFISHHHSPRVLAQRLKDVYSHILVASRLVEKLSAHLAQTEARHKAQVEELMGHLAKTEAQHKARVEELMARHQTEAEHLRDRITQLNRLLHHRSVNLAEDERYIGELTDRLRKQLWNTRRLSHLLEDAEKASERLSASRRWKLANPGATLKAKLSHGKASGGYGHLEKVVNAYSQWRTGHPEIAKIDDEIKAAQVPKIPRTPLVETDEQVGSSDGSNKAGRAEGTPPDKPPTTPAGPTPLLPLTSLHFPAHKEAEVSVVIPVFNQLSFTHACLVSLQAVQEQPRFEVIIVDDCSTDRTAELVPQIPGIIYLRNETNSGFIVSCNLGAKKARGKYLFFLNNDTVVKQGWLSALLDTFAEEPQAGIVGSKLVYPDGRLQEAGGIIWQDASGWNYGKFDDPQKPEYNYLREVDYCSGAALMIPKALFLSLGGFDSRYEPAYYEDTDLAFKVRQAGHKVLYQPLSEVIHYEGATGGTDLSTGTKKHQEINRSTFAETWAAELKRKPANGDLTFLQQPRKPSAKNILVIDHHLPMPDRDSGSLRMFQILKLLHQLGHRVIFIPDNLAGMPPYTGELQKRGIQVLYHPYVQKVRDYLITHGSGFDVIVLSRCQFACKHIADARLYAPQSRIIFDTVDLHFLREAGEARLTGDPEVERKAEETRQQEYELIDQFDETWVVSTTEQRLLQEKWPEKSIQLVSNIVDAPGSKTPFALRRDWLFIGSFQHPPNIDAVLFFLKEIYPLVSKHLHDAKFYIIGDKAPPEIVALATERIVVAGLQRDVRAFFESVKLSVAPLRFGAGVKGKINQSMGFGVPVIATSVAVEGTKLRDREDILVADEPEDFAQALIELYESEELWNRLSENGIRKTRVLYSTEAAREKLEFLFGDEHLRSWEKLPALQQPEIALAAKT